MTISRDDARKLAAEGSKLGITVIGGNLYKEGDHYSVNKIDITALLEELVGQNIVLVVSGVEDDAETEVKTCMTCGNEYTQDACPRCANVRSRLRGEA
ncbi:MAG: hypothetical protein AAF629_25465 [Chloroflexota bacterium]